MLKLAPSCSPHAERPCPQHRALPRGKWDGCKCIPNVEHQVHRRGAGIGFQRACRRQVGGAPSGAPGGSAPGNAGGNATAASVMYKAAYKVDGQTASKSGQTYAATGADESAVRVTNAGKLTLTDAKITTSGNTSSQDSSSFYGLNAGVLADAGSQITLSDSSVTTTGSGANGVFATGSGSSVTLSNVTIKATADGGHGVMATNGGTLTLSNVDMERPELARPLATDRGGGTITVNGGTMKTSGTNSPGIYSTGAITVTGATYWPPAPRPP